MDVSSVNIDVVFKNITKMYTKKLLSVVHGCFIMMENMSNVEDKRNVYMGLQQILIPQNKKIKTWIRENLTC